MKKNEEKRPEEGQDTAEPCRKLTLKKVGSRELSHEELKLVAGATGASAGRACPMMSESF